MAKSVNTVHLLGFIGKDAETKFTGSGKGVVRFSVATERSYKKGEEWVSETEWHNITLWNGEKLANGLLKGKQVYVGGRIHYGSYTGKDGNTKYTTEIVADQVILVGGREQVKAASPALDFPTEEEPF